MERRRRSSGISSEAVRVGMLVRRRDFRSDEVWSVVRVKADVREAWILHTDGRRHLVGLRNLEEAVGVSSASPPRSAAASTEDEDPDGADDTQKWEEDDRASAASERVRAAPDCASVLGLTMAEIDADDDPRSLIARKLQGLKRQRLDASAQDRAAGAAEWLSKNLRPQWYRAGGKDDVEVKFVPPASLRSADEDVEAHQVLEVALRRDRERKATSIDVEDDCVWLPGVRRRGGVVEVTSRADGDATDCRVVRSVPRDEVRPTSSWGRAVAWQRLASGRVVVADRPDGYRRGDRVFLHDKRTGGGLGAGLIWRRSTTRNLYDVALDVNAAGSRDLDACLRADVRDAELSPTDEAPPADDGDGDDDDTAGGARPRAAPREGDDATRGDAKRRKGASYGPSDPGQEKGAKVANFKRLVSRSVSTRFG